MSPHDPGILIAVEGIDGAGKTTQVKMLADFLRQAGESVVTSKEPTDGPWGQKIRQSAATGRMELAEELHAFVEDRKQHVREVIAPGLARGAVVLLDRYYFSTLAYQGARGADVAAMTATMQAIAPEPAVVLLIDVPADMGLSRVSINRGDIPNAFEDQSLRAVRSLFLKLAEGNPCMVVIDGTPGAAAVHQGIVDVLTKGVLKDRRWARR